MKKSSSSNSSKIGKGRGGASDSSSPSTAPASSSFSSQRLTQLFDSFLSDDPEEDRQSLPQEGIVKFAQAMGIEDPEGDVRVLVLMWKLGARRRPGQISREEFEGALKQLELDTLDKLRDRLLPSLDVDFLQGDDFKSFYRFAFLFSLEGTRRNIEKDMIVELLPMVIGQRSEYTSSFIAFLNETKKPEEMITADQWNQFYDFSLTYPTLEQLFKGYEEDSAWPLLIDSFVDYLKAQQTGGIPAGGGGAATSTPGKGGGGRGKGGGGSARK